MESNEYNEFVKRYKRALKQTLLEIEFFLEDIGNINVFSISSRIKEYKSALIKSQRIKKEIKDLQDIAGIRIVVNTLEEVEIISQFFSRKEILKDLIIESNKNISKLDGYRAKHIIVSLKGNYSRSMYPTRIEIQIATIFQYAFNNISRSWAYKTNNLYSDTWRKSFIEISKKLEFLDKEISVLQKEVIDYSVNNSDNNFITPLSLQKLIKVVFNEEMTLGDAVDYCQMLVDIGYKTNNHLRQFLESEKIENLRNEMMGLRSENTKFLSDAVLKFSKSEFWLFFGIRFEGTTELINSLNNK